ncbi:serine--tRNA ligase [Marinivivus vitaminiproducens]|uniref:serine--tRNA ligase n=1 Tax=Marinivivus vitaminiproducens TaxID=3035935 RepID=UPI0027AA669E|nr:serine--tRNA ligase [Geminicoccaceae bacterium SCSIO 64248]
MHDLRGLREQPAAFDRALARRGLAPVAERLVALDAERRRLQTQQQEAQAERNSVSRDIGRIKAQGGDAGAAMARVQVLKEQMARIDAELPPLALEIDSLLAGLPNIPADDAPDGVDENENVEVRRVGAPANLAFDPREHDVLGAALGMDFARAARMSGARFVILKAGLARLARALGQFMLDVHVSEHGYVEVASPYLVREQALFGVGQLPKFADDLFRTNDDHWLIPTSEVTLTNMVAGEIVDEEDLPLRFAALTPCFRLEAGAAGKDTRGMIRQHQFDKVELVSVTTPESSDAEQERLVGCAETILSRLGLSYRVVSLCTGDLGFSARRTYDLEVWLPGQGRYREISSCSTCGDFQARRMDARCRPRGAKASTRFVHTLNGSGVAVGRALVAVLETYQQADGSILIPDVLQGRMGGLERLVPDAA